MTYRRTVAASSSRGHKLARRTSGNVSLTSTSWASVDTGMDLALSGVAAGDIVVATVQGFLSASATVTIYLDVQCVASSNYFSSLTSTPASEGMPGWKAVPYTANAGDRVSGDASYAVQSGDISSGAVTFRLRYRADVVTGRTLNASTSSPLVFSVQNLGQPQA